MSRTFHSWRNLITSIVGQLLMLILGFVTRSFFIRLLGEQYLGINGLFGNIIAMLSLADLGLGAAITYSLYKPIAENDEPRIHALMRFYKLSFRVISLFVVGIGLMLLPFLPHLIDEPPTFINYRVVYLLFLLQSASTYTFFAYKSSLLRASQREYVITRIGYFFSIGSGVLQIAALHLYPNYYVYLSILILTYLVQNAVVAAKADRIFPFLRKKPTVTLAPGEVRSFLKDCYALTLFRLNQVILYATDSIIISKYLGLSMVGLYSNYSLITKHVKTLLDTFFSAITASLGNLHATADAETGVKREILVYKAVNLFVVYAFGISAVMIFVLANPFITLWLGERYLFSTSFVIVLCVDFYIYGINKINATFRDTMGIFQKAKYRPLAGAVINLVVSVILVRPLGVTGVLLGTVISHLCAYIWLDPLVVIKHGMGSSPAWYFRNNALFVLLLAAGGYAAHAACGLLPGGAVVRLLLSAAVAFALPALLITLFFHRSEEFRYLMDALRKMLTLFHDRKR